MIDLQALRKEYEDFGIDPDQMNADPYEEFQAWLLEAAAKSPGSWYEPNAMTLATGDRQGNVTSRTVLLKRFDSRGLVFFTNYDSQKAQQLDQNPRASLLFHWPHLGRQVRIDGVVRRTSREVSDQYFHSRPRGSQISAYISRQSQPVSSRDQLQQAVAEIERQFDGRPIPLPDDWGGFLVEPDLFEFWQGRTDRLHDRIQYRREDSGQWTRQRLAP